MFEGNVFESHVKAREKNVFPKEPVFRRIVLLFSAHIPCGKGKYLNQTVFFTKLDKHQI